MTPDSASGTADRPLHMLSVWNPSNADDAMDQHLEVEDVDLGAQMWGSRRGKIGLLALAGEPYPIYLASALLGRLIRRIELLKAAQPSIQPFY